MAAARKRRGMRPVTREIDVGPMLARALQFLQGCPRGASRVDILTAINLQPSAWPAVRLALEASGDVVVLGRGPGLRHVHRTWAEQHPAANRVPLRAGGERLREARLALRDVLREKRIIDSGDAQLATGLKADPVRRLLLELVHEGKVERSGSKRSTRYRWVG